MPLRCPTTDRGHIARLACYYIVGGNPGHQGEPQDQGVQVGPAGPAGDEGGRLVRRRSLGQLLVVVVQLVGASQAQNRFQAATLKWPGRTAISLRSASASSQRFSAAAGLLASRRSTSSKLHQYFHYSAATAS